MTCGTCGRECLPDGDCYGCEADRQRQLAAALAEASNMWRAHAEALAGALLECRVQGPLENPCFQLCEAHGYSEHTDDCRRKRATLARLPADALAERRALEAVAAAAHAVAPHLDRLWMYLDERRNAELLREALAALAVARGTGGA